MEVTNNKTGNQGIENPVDRLLHGDDQSELIAKFHDPCIEQDNQGNAKKAPENCVAEDYIGTSFSEADADPYYLS